jgi:hypothetical protein
LITQRLKTLKLRNKHSETRKTTKKTASRTGTGEDKGNLTIAEMVYTDRLEEEIVPGGIQKSFK